MHAGCYRCFFVFLFGVFKSGSCPSLDKTFEDVSLEAQAGLPLYHAACVWELGRPRSAFSLPSSLLGSLCLSSPSPVNAKCEVDKVNYSQSRVLLGTNQYSGN